MKKALYRKGRWEFRCYCGNKVSFHRIESIPQCPHCKTEYDTTIAIAENVHPRLIKGVFVEEKTALDK